MLRACILCFGVIVVVASLAHSQQSRTIMSASASPHPGINVRFTTVVTGGAGGSQLDLSSAVRTSSGKAHRYLIDTKDRIYFGYDIAVEPIQDSNSCRVLISPLSLNVQDLAQGSPAKGSQGASAT